MPDPETDVTIRKAYQSTKEWAFRAGVLAFD
jgi:hypothetical protein